MFAAILRRWRLVTPLALAVLAISVVAGGALMPASAHTAKFHFFARAYALADDTTAIPDTTCDTGYLAITGGIIETRSDGHTGCGETELQGEPGAGITGSGRLEAGLEDSKLVGTHSAHKGSVLAIVDMEEATGAHQVNPEGCIPAGPSGPICGGVQPDSPQFVVGGKVVHPILNLFEDSFAVAQASDVLFWGDLIRVFAEAECHTRLNGTTHASVKASVELSDAAVREDNRLHYIGPQGSVGNAGDANTTFTISGFTTASGLIIRDIVVIVNEQHQIEDGDAAGISANAIHLIGTGDDGRVDFNFILGHAFAGIHCARHLDGQDTLTIPGA